MLRLLFLSALLAPACALAAEPVEIALFNDSETSKRISEAEASLVAVRDTLADCEEGCIVPSEAVSMAFLAGEGERTPGRFLLDVRGGGRSMQGELEDLFFVNSVQGYALFGTLTIAFETDALMALLRRARSCGGGLTDGRIEVKGCRKNEQFDLNMFTMMQRLNNKRLVVDGDVRLQWIDSRLGAPREEGGEPGYYQVWVRVENADQVTIVYQD